MENKKIFFGFIAILLVLIIGSIFYFERVLNQGEEIILKTRPVDPRDLLRGDYVILHYEIEDDPKIKDFLKINSEEIKRGDRFYMYLDNSDKENVKVKDVSFIPGSELYLEAEYLGYNRIRLPQIDKYFVPEGEGGEIERQIGNISVLVSILGDRALIKKIILDDKE